VPHVDRGESGRFDIAGSVTLTVGLVSVVLAVTWMGTRGPGTILALTLGILSFAAFFVAELRAREPIVPLRLFANRTIAAGTVVSAIVGVGLFSITAYLPTYFQMAYRTSATVSGLVPIATVFGMLVSNLGTGWLASRTGRYRPYTIAGTAVGAAGLAVMAVLPGGLPLWVPMVVMAVVGLGTGAFMSLIVAVVQSAAPARDTGTITATVNLVRQVGSTVATALIGALIGVGVAALLPAGVDAATLAPSVVHAAPPELQQRIAEVYGEVFAPIFLGLAVTYAIGVVAAALLPNRRLSDHPDPTMSGDADVAVPEPEAA
jgi:MFS family permease